MKKRLLLTIILSLTMGVAACGDDTEPAANNGNNGTADAGTDTEDGGAEDGGTEDGGTEDGGTEDGGTEDGGTDGGDTDDGGTTALNAITAEDQALEGATSNEVTIASVTLEEDGFVVIHEDDGGAPGAVIGNERVVAGDNTADVTVTLDRNAANGETLYAMLHGDTNDNETYDFTGAGSEDGPLLDDNDAPITDSFVVNVPSVTASDLTLAAANDDLSTIVTVDSAYSNGAGWLVIHENDCSNFGAVLGQSALTDGENTDISVTLTERPAADGESLCAMLHADTGTADEYEFDGTAGSEDGPIALADDSVVMDSFAITIDGDVPAIRITLSANGQQNYLVDSVEPAYFDNGLSAVTDDPDFTFLDGWRYEINNTVEGAHPFELLAADSLSGDATVVLSQKDGVDPADEDDTDTNWFDDGNIARFTVAGDAFAGTGTVATGHDGVDSYQCGNHPGMTGAVTVQ